jgi:hypothetical protein
MPEIPLKVNSDYLLVLLQDVPGNTSGNGVKTRQEVPFKTADRSQYDTYWSQNDSPLAIYATGIFLFVLFLSIGGVLWGISGLAAFTWNVRNTKNDLPVFLLGLRGLFLILAISCISTGIYLLATNGWLIITYA